MIQATIDLDKIKDQDTREAVKNITSNVLGNVIELSAAATTAGEELKPNELGYYSDTLYININGTTYSISLTEV